MATRYFKIYKYNHDLMNVLARLVFMGCELLMYLTIHRLSEVSQHHIGKGHH